MILSFTLKNVGKPVFHYHWLWGSDSMVSISAATTSGLVGPQAKLGLNLQLTALRRTAFHQLKVQLFISKGPTFVLLLSGTAAQPVFKFSFCQHNFGPCFVQNSDVDYNKTDLTFSNMDENPLL
ncbi:hydrocephalus-inducing protein homolog [Homalodisca vitripennis]|nr:hydrocephalus-inducing protein homolog [Homalodisca vitripennis]